MRLRIDPGASAVKPGSWQAITPLFNSKFNTNKTEESLKSFYRDNRLTLHSNDVRQGRFTEVEAKWLKQTADEYISPLLGVMPAGAWQCIAEEFRKQFGYMRTPSSLREKYKRMQ